MGIFNKKESASTKSHGEIKKKVEKVVKKPAVKDATEKQEAPKSGQVKNGKIFSVLKRIRITEKSTDLSADHNTIVFEIDNNSNKIEVAKAIEKFYGVTPKKVRIVRIPSKNVKSKGKKGVKSGGKKAYVFLKEGDKIEAV